MEQAKRVARKNDDILSRSFVLEKIKVWEIENKRESINVNEIKPVEGLYNVIYADPPWRYEFGTNKRRVENHYPTMCLQEIKELKIPCMDDSVLFLWATSALLPEALEVLSAWGFLYVSQYIWDKETKGLGYWMRGQHEILLVGKKGELRAPIPKLRIGSVYREKRGKHSRKPNYFYEIIEKQFPNGKYLELFARRKYSEKWTVWGNQV